MSFFLLKKLYFVNSLIDFTLLNLYIKYKVIIMKSTIYSIYLTFKYIFKVIMFK